MSCVKILLDCGAVQRPLCTVSVGRASTLIAEVLNAPDGLQELQLHIGRIGRDDFISIPAMPRTDGRWAVYASGLNFQDEGVTKYHVTGIEARGGSVWLGSGRLEILPSVLNADSGSISPVPEDTYIRNPDTGLWHKLTVEVFDGVLTPVVGEGVTR